MTMKKKAKLPIYIIVVYKRRWWQWRRLYVVAFNFVGLVREQQIQGNGRHHQCHSTLARKDRLMGIWLAKAPFPCQFRQKAVENACVFSSLLTIIMEYTHYYWLFVPCWVLPKWSEHGAYIYLIMPYHHTHTLFSKEKVQRTIGDSIFLPCWQAETVRGILSYTFRCLI